MITTMIISISVSIFLMITSQINGHEYNEEGWNTASAYLRASMDRSQNPCKEFYKFACGRWMQRESREAEDELSNALLKLRNSLLSALDNMSAKSIQKRPEYQESLHTIYKQCMDLRVMSEKELLVETYQASIFAMTIMLLSTMGTRLEGKMKTTTTGVQETLITAGLMEQNFYQQFLFDTTLQTVTVDCVEKPVLKLSPPWSVYLGMNEEKIVQSYQIIGEAIGKNFTNSEYKAKSIKELQGDLERLISYAEEMKMQEKDEHGKLIKLSKLADAFPDLDLNSYFEGLFPEQSLDRWNATDPYVLIMNEYYFKNLSSVLNRYENDTVLEYMYWKLVHQIKEEIYKKKTEGAVKSGISRKKKGEFCYEILKQFAPAAVARMFFDILKADVMEWQKDVELLSHNILSAFRIFVSGQDWLDAVDKMSLMERINNVKIHTGIASWLANDTEVNRRTRSFVPSQSIMWNIFTSERHRFQEAMEPLITPGLSDVELSPRFQFGATYSYGEIKINLGQLLPPLYHHNYPLAVKYGMLGWLLGHELLHGFDEASLKEGPLEDVEKMFHQRKRCLVKQYSSYCYRNQEGAPCLSGKRTVNENIGDIEGLKIAYMAYKFVTQTVGTEPPLPEMVQFSNDQAFFISAAQLHCGELYDWIVSEWYHPPSNVRVEQSMRNFPIFAQTFECKRSSKYAPIRTCSLWGRFVSPNQCDQEELDQDDVWQP